MWVDLLYWQKVTRVTFLSAYEKVERTTFLSWLKMRLIFVNTPASIRRILSRVTLNSRPSNLTTGSIPQYIDGGVHFHCVAAFGAFAWIYPQFHLMIFGTVTVVVGGHPVIVGRQPRFLGGHYS